VRLRAGRDMTTMDFMGVLPFVDAGFDMQVLSRPRYEATLRAKVLALANVEFLEDAAVERLAIEKGRCAGVEMTDGETISADFVVDCTGMNGPLVNRLAADGEAVFEAEEVKINVSYTSAMFERPARYRGEAQGFYILPGAPNPSFSIVLPVEEDRWMVSLGTRGATTVPRDLAGYLGFAEALPKSFIFERLKDATPLTDIKTFRKTFVTRRQFATASRWPTRLACLGDAMTSFNPTFGQGMTVAAMQAAALARTLAARDTLDGVAADFFPVAEAIAGQAWGMAISTDYTYAETEGPRPADFAQSSGFSRMLRALAEKDLDLLAVRHRIGHMLETGMVLRQSPWSEKIAAAMQAMKEPA
jgi:2-polyprenyl-6-methoxyphenol hydroxylase-like FAD-dependent oxidoreductase